MLFVHGAHLAGWCWLLVMDQLGRRGIDSQAIDLPLTGYADDVEYVRAAIEAARSRWGAVHVVCHSYAGLPVAEAGHAAAHVTFVAGRLPLAGESPAAETPRWQVPEFQACMEPDDDGVVRLSSAAGRSFFCHRSPVALADYAMDRLRPMGSTVPSAAFADPAWTTVPSSYVVCADDRAVRPEAQRERAARVGTSVELDTDHSPFFSGAAALADFIADRHRAMAGS
ncbi:MAG: alpha/beta hydrolase [Acidimicrobiales bacterium]